MKYKRNNYPYPVLNPKTDDYNIINPIEMEIQIIDNKDYILLNFSKLKINCKEINELINNKKAKCVLNFECSKTSFRNVISFNNIPEGIEIKIPAHKVRNKVEIAFYVITTEKITDYYSIDFNQDYGNTKFNIDKYSYLVTVFAEAKVDKENFLGKLHSIFSVILDQDKDAKAMRVQFDDSKILILLNKEDYDIYKVMYNDPNYTRIFDSLFIFPSLIAAFEEIKRRPDSHRDSSWYRSIDKKLKTLNTSIDDFKEKEDFEDIMNYAQMVFDYPVANTFKALENLRNTNRVEIE